MKKIIFLALTLLSACAFAIDSKGELNVGIGYNFMLSGGLNSNNVGAKSGITFDLAPYLKLDNNVAIGVETGYITLVAASETLGGATASARMSAIPALLSLKFYPVDNFSFFAGAGVSFITLGVSTSGTIGSLSSSVTETFVSADVGASYSIPVASNISIDPAAKFFIILAKDGGSTVFNFNPMVNMSFHF